MRDKKKYGHKPRNLVISLRISEEDLQAATDLTEQANKLWGMKRYSRNDIIIHAIKNLTISQC